jgi:DNA-binding transcriptional LysR family regulator
MSQIESRLFHYFVAVAEELHFAQAAERLGITPPTLTHQIQKLERDLGVKLLKRKGNRKVVITDAGVRVLAGAREVLRHIEETTTVGRKAGRGELGRLELGFMLSVSGAGLLDDWIGPFERANPAIEVATHRLASMAQVLAIMSDKLDGGFARTPTKYPSGVRGFEVYRQGMALALQRKHPLTRHKTINPTMLASEAFVSIKHELDFGFLSYTAAVAGIGNFTPRVVRREDDFIAVLSYVARGHGVAVVPELLTKTTTFSNVVFRSIEADPAPQMSIAFIYSSDPSPSANLLIQHMRRHALRNSDKGPARPSSESPRPKGVARPVFSHAA